MSYREIGTYQRRLDDLFKKAGSFDGDIEMESHWACYLCVLVCGYLEVSVRAALGHYVRSRASAEVLRHVQAGLNGFANPNMEKILQLVGSFDKDWRNELEEATKGEHKDAVDSIVDIRHALAHGRSHGLTMSRITTYYKSAVKVVELLVARCTA